MKLPNFKCHKKSRLLGSENIKATNVLDNLQTCSKPICYFAKCCKYFFLFVNSFRGHAPGYI